MSNKKESVALSSVIASFALTILKLVVGFITGSIGILSEAAHSFLDLGAAMMTLLAVRVSDKPADKVHQYGHGKIESLSALAETALLLITSGIIIYEAINRLFFHSVEIQATWYAFAVMIISIIIDITRSRALLKIAKETNSQALEADALHFSSDIWSSLVVILGLFFVLLGVKGADALAAVGVAVLVIFASIKLFRRTIDVLLDTAPAGMEENIRNFVNKIDGVVNISRLRIRSTSITYFIDMAVDISRKLPLDQVKKITEQIETGIKKSIKDADITVHINPIALEGETIVERVRMIAQNHNLSAHDITVYSQKGRTFVNFDLEVDDKLGIQEAHKKASHLEIAIKEELGSQTEVNTHIEPIKHLSSPSKTISLQEIREVKIAIEKVKTQISALTDVHKLDVKKIKDKLFITLHCIFRRGTTLKTAHQLSSKMEYLIRSELPQVERVVVHVEPNA